MTQPLFRDDAYLTETTARVFALTDEGGIVLDRTLFYPTGGGQPGDSGWIDWPGGQIEIATCIKGTEGALIAVPAAPGPLPPVGVEVILRLDWGRRLRHMRIHTALHLLSVVIPLPVTGGSISADKGRLDFDMPESPEDKTAIEVALNDLVARNLEVTESWISDDELQANPGLVKTMSVAPPMGTGKIRLVMIGSGANQIDLQPCGGTHVRHTGEIGRLRLGKIEKKGAQNRRVYIHTV